MRRLWQRKFTLGFAKSTNICYFFSYRKLKEWNENGTSHSVESIAMILPFVFGEEPKHLNRPPDSIGGDAGKGLREAGAKGCPLSNFENSGGGMECGMGVAKAREGGL